MANPAPRKNPQHLVALERANRVRLARASLKRQIAAGERSAAEVIADPPFEARSMSVMELLTSQRRWGVTRSRRALRAAYIVTGNGEVAERKALETLTPRQREALVAILGGGRRG